MAKRTGGAAAQPKKQTPVAGGKAKAKARGVPVAGKRGAAGGLLGRGAKKPAAGRGKGRKGAEAKPTAEALDKELDSYMHSAPAEPAAAGAAPMAE